MAFGTRSLAARRALHIFATLFLLAMAIHVQPVVRAAPVVIETRVAASSDDAEEFPTGAVSLTSTDLELVLEPNRGNQVVGIRFPAIAIPNGVTVTSAYIQFQVDEASSDATTLTIAAEASDTAATFTTATGVVSSLPRTTASVLWSPPAWPTVGAVGPDQRTPNLASVIQAVISRPGWSSGNALALIVSGSGHRVARAWDGSPAGAPLLHIEYDASQTVPTPIVSSFSPTSGLPGDSVTVQGSNFLGATGVSFNGAPAGFSIVSDTQLRAVVPSGASTGPLSVTNEGGTGTSTAAFTIQTPSAIRVPADYPTIQAAINAAQSGATILVSPGTYVEPLSIGKKITLASEYYTTGDPSLIDATVLRGTGSNDGAVIQTAAAGTSIIGFTIINPTPAGSNGPFLDGIRPEGSAQILHNHIVAYDDGVDFNIPAGTVGTCVCSFNIIENGTDDGLDFDGATQGTIEGNILRNNHEDGYEIRLDAYSGPLNLTVRGNTMSGNGQDGMQIIDLTGASDRRFRIEGNEIVNNGRVGLGLMDNANSGEDYRAASLLDQIDVINNTFSGNNYGISGGDNLVAVNNIFANHRTLGMKNVDGGSTVAYNLFWGNATNFTGSNVDTSTTLIADPLLNADFTLRSGSPAIDAGTASFQWRGTSVVNLPPGSYSGSAPDLGAHESGGTGNPPTATPTRTSTASATASATATSTPSATNTPTASNTPPATNTPTGTQVDTVTPTSTNTPTSTSTATPTATSTSTATSTPVPTSTSSGGTGTLTYSAEADARVDAAAANSNFGAVTSLPVDSSPQQESFLRFTVSGVGGPVTSARLRLFVTNGTTNGPPIFLTGNTWSETGLTWNTKPARIGSGVDDKTNIAASAWVEYNVTSLVGGNGTYSFTFLPQSSDAITFNSREAGSNQPQLIVSFNGSGPTATPSATATTPPTVTSTPSPTATFTSTPTASVQPTATPTETTPPSETPVPSATDIPTDTATAAPTNTPAPTDTPAATATPTETLVPTATPTNTAVPPPTATATPASGPLFTDGFESGNLTAWRTIKGLTVQPDLVRTGSYAARGTSTTAATYARVQLDASQTDLYFRTFINIQSQSSATVYFIRFRNASDASFLGVYSNSSGRIGYRNDLSGLSTTSTATISKGVWHEVEMHAIVNGAGGLVEIWLDGNLVISKAENLGTNPTQIIQIGENGTGSRSYDIAFDDVMAATSFIAPSGSAIAAQARIAYTATPTLTPQSTATATLAPTETPVPTESPAPTATDTPSPEPTPNEAPTVTPTPEATTNDASPTP